MGRLIDADALISKYGEWYVEEGTEEGFIGTVKQLADTLPSVDVPGTNVGKWIPCSKRMPEVDGKYIISGKWVSGKEETGECYYYIHDGYFETSWNFDVTAWQPLPEPYKE